VVRQALLALTLTLARPVTAQPFEGLSALAAMSPKFNRDQAGGDPSPCSQLVRALWHVPKPALQVLWGTFGSDTECVERFAYAFSDRPRLVEVHLLNGPCIRNNRCGAGEPFRNHTVSWLNRQLEKRNPKVMKALKARIEEVRSVAEILRGIDARVAVSTGLETNYSRKAIKAEKPLARGGGGREQCHGRFHSGWSAGVATAIVPNGPALVYALLAKASGGSSFGSPPSSGRAGGRVVVNACPLHATPVPLGRRVI
jgi:hypothetical protein